MFVLHQTHVGLSYDFYIFHENHILALISLSFLSFREFIAEECIIIHVFSYHSLARKSHCYYLTSTSSYLYLFRFLKESVKVQCSKNYYYYYVGFSPVISLGAIEVNLGYDL